MERVQTGLKNVVLAAYTCPVGGLRDRPPLCNGKKTRPVAGCRHVCRGAFGPSGARAAPPEGISRAIGEVRFSGLAFLLAPGLWRLSGFGKLFHDGAILQLHFTVMIQMWKNWRCRGQCAANLLQCIEKHDKIKIITVWRSLGHYNAFAMSARENRKMGRFWKVQENARIPDGAPVRKNTWRRLQWPKK